MITKTKFRVEKNYVTTTGISEIQYAILKRGQSSEDLISSDLKSNEGQEAEMGLKLCSTLGGIISLDILLTTGSAIDHQRKGINDGLDGCKMSNHGNRLASIHTDSCWNLQLNITNKHPGVSLTLDMLCGL